MISIDTGWRRESYRSFSGRNIAAKVLNKRPVDRIMKRTVYLLRSEQGEALRG